MLVSAHLIEIHESIFAVVRAAKLCTVPIVFAFSSIADQEELSKVPLLQTTLTCNPRGLSSKGRRHIPN
jgi:hypothetical protein